MMFTPPITHWSLPFLQLRQGANNDASGSRKATALIILNQPFSRPLLRRLWQASDWHCCADGGANRLHDLLLRSRNDDAATTTTTTTTTTVAATATTTTPADLFIQRGTTTTGVDDYLPDLIKGDLDSVREDVRLYYENRVSS
jgi:thiamine pyrophosphokinase